MAQENEQSLHLLVPKTDSGMLHIGSPLMRSQACTVYISIVLEQENYKHCTPSSLLCSRESRKGNSMEQQMQTER